MWIIVWLILRSTIIKPFSEKQSVVSSWRHIRLFKSACINLRMKWGTLLLVVCYTVDYRVNTKVHDLSTVSLSQDTSIVAEVKHAFSYSPLSWAPLLPYCFIALYISQFTQITTIYYESSCPVDDRCRSFYTHVAAAHIARVVLHVSYHWNRLYMMARYKCYHVLSYFIPNNMIAFPNNINVPSISNHVRFEKKCVYIN